MEEIYTGVQTRFDLNSLNYRRLQSDYIRFENKLCMKLPNTYLCKILYFYLCYRQDHKYADFEEEIRCCIEDHINDHDDFAYSERLTFRSNLAKKCTEFEFNGLEYLKKRSLVNKLLADYCNLGLSEREMVYCYENYSKILMAIEKQHMLIVDTGYNQYEYKPYQISIDENSFFYYLAGYSRKLGDKGDFDIFSIKLNNIKDCIVKKRQISLTNKERKEIISRISKQGIAYVYGEQIPIKIRLSKKGYNMYLSRVHHQRPIPKCTPKEEVINGLTYYFMDFNCSYNQIRNYFFTFGCEVVILEPKISRDGFRYDYQNAMQEYLELDNKTLEIIPIKK